MNVTLSPEVQRRIAEKVERGDVERADDFIEQALSFYLDYEESEMDDEDFRSTKAAIDEALKQGENREGRPAEKVFADMRARHGLSR